MTRLQILMGVLVIVVLVLVGVFYINSERNTAPNKASTGATSTTETDIKNLPPTAQQAMKVSQYLIDNIATISTVPTSSSTKLTVSRTMLNNGTGTVEFGDGMKTYTADFDYSASGTDISITNFRIRY